MKIRSNIVLYLTVLFLVCSCSVQDQKIKKSDVKEELKGIAKDGVLEVGKQAGQITNPVGQFSVGQVVAGAAVIATATTIGDHKTNTDNTVITNSSVDTVNFLGENESFNLISNDSDVRDEVAAGLYFRDIGSRKGLTPTESNIEYEASSDSIKNVYTNKAITDIRKLVTDGYIKISRESQDVEVATEKVGI